MRKGVKYPSWVALSWWLTGKEPTHLLMQGMRVPSLGWEDPLEEETATHSSILAFDKFLGTATNVVPNKLN